ncbi:MAG: exosortase E/protease, VPEID-CTERM system [Polyangiales bacterium]
MPEPAARNRYFGPLLALALLTTEYLAVSFRFDALGMLDREGAWEPLGWLGFLGPGVFAFATALWILGGSKIRRAFARSTPDAEFPPRIWARLVAQLLCFGAFYSITSLVFGQDAPPEGPPELWILLLFLGGAATLLALVPIAANGLRSTELLRELAAPMGFASLVGLVAWGAGVATLGLWNHLNRITLDAVAATLELFVSPIYFDPADVAVGTEEFWVRVLPVCSGYEGIGLILVFLSAYLVAFRERFRFPQVLVLLPATIACVWLLNVVRIVLLILVGHAGYADIALGGFHSKAGWLFFCAVALGAVWVSQQVRWFARDPDAPRGEVVNPSAPFLLPLLAVVATALLTGLFAIELDYFYPLRAVVGLLVLAWYWKEYVNGLRDHLRGRPIVSWQAIGVGVLVYVVWVGVSALIEPFGSEAPPEALTEIAPPLAAVWVIGRVLGAVLVIPIVEELAFRGFALRRLLSSEFERVSYERWSWLAVLGSSVLFAAFHQQWIGGFAAGLLYAYAQKRRGLLSDAIIAHAVSNALIAAEVLLAGHWSLW